MAELTWGRRYLMCPPRYFEIAYEINPWMHRDVTVDPDRALAQWEGLRRTLEEAGADVELLDPVPGAPDLVFTANAGFMNAGRFVPSNFAHPERQVETPHDLAWFIQHDYRIDRLPANVHYEGAGDSLPFGKVLLAGYRTRSDAASHVHLSALLHVAVRSIELLDDRLYHLDLTFCPLDERRAIIAPTAWDAYGRRVVASVVAEPLVLSADEALSFCANSIVVGKTVIMPCCPPPVGRQLERWGFDVAICAVDEFLKAGGGCRCLTLPLDIDLTTSVSPG